MTTWDELREEVGKRVYRIQMADGYVAPEEADRRWDAYWARVRGTSHGANELDVIDNIVGDALSALRDMGLINYRSKGEREQ